MRTGRFPQTDLQQLFAARSKQPDGILGAARVMAHVVMLAILGLLAFAPTRAHAEVDCDNPPPDYTAEDIRAPMRFFYPDSAACFGNAVNQSYIGVGIITADTPAKFEAFVKNNPPDTPIELASPGGDLMAGLKLGAIIRGAGYDTALGTTCASACAYALLGGVRRYAILKDFDDDTDYDNRVVGAQGTKLGIHQFYHETALTEPLKKAFTAADRSADQALTALLLEYVDRMGVDTRFVSAASGVKPTSMHWLTPEEMLAWNVDNVQRRYTPMVLHAFDPDGAYVEIANIRGKEESRLRIYCTSGLKEPVFAFVTNIRPDQNQPGASVQSRIRAATDKVRGLLKATVIALKLDTSERLDLPLEIKELRGAPQSDGSVRVVTAVRPVGFTRKNAERLAHVSLRDNGNLSRADWTFQDVVKFRVHGDHKLIRLAMKNCSQ